MTPCRHGIQDIPVKKIHFHYSRAEFVDVFEHTRH